MTAMVGQKSFFGTTLQTSTLQGKQARQGAVQTQALLGKLKKSDRKRVKDTKNSEVFKQKKLVPFDQKLKDTAPKRTFKMDEARNLPRQGGFGQGKPFQKQKIGPKMEGTPVTSSIDPLLFVLGLCGFTVVTVGGLIAGS